MSVRRAQLEISGPEFAEWMAYCRIDPFGEERADLRSGIIAATIANIHRGKGTRSFKPGDFMPDFKPKVQQSWQQMKSMFKAFARTHNAMEAKKRG